ncbi:MAG: phosphatidate cytidylyltransferase [Actinomycetota bacterium]
MGQPPDEREPGTDEDLFEDLDQFFAPLEGSDWPQEEEPAEPPPGPPSEEEPAANEEEVDLEALSIDLPEEEELVPRAEPTEEPAARGEPAGRAEDSYEFFEEGEEQPAGGAAEAPGQEWIGEATAEMEVEDWDALREASARPEPQAPPGTPVAGEEPPLSLDDLKTPPPEYAALPGPPEEPVLEEEATIRSLEDLEGIEEPSEPAGEEGALTSPAEVGEAEAPPRESVEAAADHFASGMRESPEEVERELLSDLEQPGVETVKIEPGQAAEVAPSWEEGGAQAVEPEAPPEEERPPPPGAGRRNLPAAFVSGVILAAAVIALLAIGKGPFAVLAVVVILLGQMEFYAVMRTRGHRPATLLGLVSGAFIVSGAYLRGEGAVLLGLFIGMAATVLWYMAAPPAQRKGVLTSAGVTLLGVVYVPFMASFALMLLRPEAGRTIFLAVVGLTILYDIAAFGIGSVWGNRPLAPTVSPSKSWEGAIGGTFVVLLAGIAVVPSFEPFAASSAVGLALLVALVAPIGDLVESAFKRDLGVKDMSGLLPGHGGVLDRIDAILFTAPAAFYFLRIFL